MKLVYTITLLAGAVSAHTIGQKLSVNGVEQAQIAGIRAPRLNDPVFSNEQLNTDAIACNVNLLPSSTVIDVPSGARIGMWWWGWLKDYMPMSSGFDTCIQTSHHGPSMFWLAKVDDAATANATALDWFKISEDGLIAPDSWAIDRMRKVDGCWTYTRLPECLAPGNYLLRSEIIAMHEASNLGGAQFYISCAQINVVGGGSWTGSNHVKFPGAYESDDPSIYATVWSFNGTYKYDNSGKPYVPPGGPVQTCPSGGSSATSTISSASSTRVASSTLASSTTRQVSSTTSTSVPSTTARPTSSTVTSTSRAATSSAPAGPAAQLYGQCGGKGWTGPTTCSSGTCKASGEYYSQCLP